ncbi:glucan phosphoethanolaminetransferase (alkaline phosphatase superfamily) [Sedimentibacter acidaminivorans]|uniref:Glucan phosphoethanolaminetransferase (Alkaline phosphatase superfamily) n=1 Tax=Sedimentibacter acidaminivorans TaxID=913099 RepID=A0ABS4GC12_9FIRM|nr:hypothetical protein [Sedimentibacter acidaminivorans]MBP1925222.1 glucan phosphoethanolaminetransferase (alkaline phosphatase superfamily) [Sedimentibacter acidaminivorans]
MKEYKYLKEWTKKKKKIIYYCVVISILILLIAFSLLILEDVISKVTLRIGMSIILILSIVLIVLFVLIRTCPKCGYYFGRHGYAPKNCPRCGIRLEE